MKKLNAILNEATIINFPFLWKLLKRYYLASLVLPAFIFAYSAFYYFTQNDVYMMSQTFDNVVDGSDSPTKALSELIGQKTKTLTESEILGMVTSVDFLTLLSTAIYDRPDFNKLNLNSISSKEHKTNKEIFSYCYQKVTCITKHMNKILPGLYHVVKNKNLTTRFILTAKTLDSNTTKVILEEVQKAIIQTRKNSLGHFISKQAELSNQLIESKIKELDGIDITETEKRYQFLSQELKDLTRELNSSSKVLSEKKISLQYLKGKLHQTRQVASGGNNSSLEKKARDLKEKIERLEQDINALEISFTNFSAEDKKILNTLKKELKGSRREFKALGGNKRYLSKTKNFVASKREDIGNLQFEYRVQKNQIKRLEETYNKLLAKKILTARKVQDMGQEMEKLKPTLTYIDKIKNKLIQLDMVKTMTVPDIIFSQNNLGMRIYKRTSKLKISIFSLSLSFFVLFLVTLIRYIFDSRIYDSYELEKNFDDLEIIGKTPDFD